MARGPENVLGNLDQPQDQHFYVDEKLKDVDNAHQDGAESTQESQKAVDGEVYSGSKAEVTRQTGTKPSGRLEDKQIGTHLNALSEALMGDGESDHVRRIREYQQRLLERHQSWKMLAETRSDIERRRNELRQRYPQLNIPQMEPLPAAKSLNLLNAQRPCLLTSLVLPSQEPREASERSLAEPVSATQSTIPHHKGQPSTFLPQPSNGVEAGNFPASLPTEVVAIPTTSPAILQTNGLADKSAPTSKVEQSKTDNVRKQLLFDSETPKTSPEKVKPKSPLRGDGNVNQIFRSDKSGPPPSGAARDFITAVPLGQSRVKKNIQVSPASISQSVDRSLDHSGIDPILALTEAAKERKLYFEKRQMQLTQQLKEIQDQKAAYLNQHEDSQRKLQEHRQRVLHEIIQGIPSGAFQDALTHGQPLEVLRKSNSTTKPESGTRHPDSLQNASFESTSSAGRKTWADLLHDPTESADSAPVDPASLLNGSQVSAPDSHRPHELSTILEVDTPPQSKSLSMSRRRSGGHDDTDGVVPEPVSLVKDISGVGKADDRFLSRVCQFLPLHPTCILTAMT